MWAEDLPTWEKISFVGLSRETTLTTVENNFFLRRATARRLRYKPAFSSTNLCSFLSFHGQIAFVPQPNGAESMG